MALPRYNLTRVEDSDVNRNLDSIKKVLDAIPQPTIALTQITVTTGLNLISHTLNKPLTGWIPTRVRSQCDLWDSQDNTAIATLPNIYLYLNASAPSVIDIEVF